MSLSGVITKLFALLFAVGLLFLLGTGEAQAQNYTNCHNTALTGNDGSIWCYSLEEASTASRNAAYNLNTNFITATREPSCTPQVRYDAYWLVLCQYRGMWGEDQVWRKAPLSSCLMSGMSDPITGLCNIPKCDSGCQPEGGNPSGSIWSAGANNSQTDSDYIGAGNFPLQFQRTYNSARTLLNTVPLPMGAGWTHSYSARLTAETINYAALDYALVYRPNGAVQLFMRSGSQWVTDADIPERISIVASGTSLVSATYTRADGTVETYDSAGKLTEITRLDGLKQTLSYATTSGTSPYVQTVTDPEGRVLTFAYTGNYLTSITDPAGNEIEYTYSGEDLTEVDYPEGSGTVTRTYHYNESGQTGGISQAHTLTGITDESSQRYASWGYDGRRRAVLSVHGSYNSGTIDRTSFVFNSNGTSTITDALGKARTYGFSVSQHVARLASLNEQCSTCANTAASKTYDANGMPDATTDFAGNVTDQDFNSRLLETQRIEASTDTSGRKRTIQTDWDSTLRIPTERRVYNSASTLVGKTEYTYNARGQVLTMTRTDPATSATRTTSTTYCEASDVTASTCPLVGLVTSVNAARTDVTDVTSFTYYMTDDTSCASSPTTCPHRKGDLWKVTNALGQVTETLSYDGAGRPTAIKDANGVIAEMTYHARGWLTSSTVKGSTSGDDRSTLIDYWPTGQVKRVTQTDGTYVDYTYDAARRLTGIEDSEGNTITYTLDYAGNRTAEATRDASSTLKRSLSRVYDLLGRLQSQADAYSNATDYTYDANGNTSEVEDALGRETGNTYDPLNRLAQAIQDMGGIDATTQFKYDAQDNLTRVTDPKGLHTDYTYNGLGDLTQLVSPDTGTTVYTYDSAGNRSSQTDARSVTATYSYDALNRLTGIAYPTNRLDVAYQYDTVNGACVSGETFALGKLTGMTDASGSTQYCYNRFGEMTRKRQVTNSQVFTTRYSYDASGHLVSQTYPDGAVLDAVRDAEGRVTELGVTPSGGSRQVVLTGATYAPFGPSTGWTYGNSRTFSRSLNQNYQPMAIHDAGAGGLSLHFTFDDAGNLTDLEDAGQTQTLSQYGYDALNRLYQTKDGPTGTSIETYGYDDTGNRTSVLKASVTTSYTYGSTDHRLTSVGAVTRSYDAAGNTTGLSTGKGYAYSDAGRMELVTQASVVQAQYKYNGKGEQVHVQDASHTYYVYDEAGHLLGKYDAGGIPVQQFLWFGDLPVGVLDGAGIGQKLHYVEPDHLGTPRVVIDGTRNVAIWKWDITGEAFGDTPPNQDPDADSTAFVFDMRYPGQRYDTATGLNYNYFRDYDSSTGRYVQSDPVGLRAGMSTYGYVLATPLIGIDPQGLTFLDVIRTNRQVNATFPELAQRGTLSCGPVGKTRDGGTDKWTGNIIVDEKYCKMKCLSRADWTDLFFTLFHEGMHSTDSWLVNNLPWRDAQIHERENYERFRNSTMQVPDSMWGNPRANRVNLNALYEQYRAGASECCQAK